MLQNSESVAVFSKGIETVDLANAIIAFTKYMQETGKAVGIIIKEKLSSEIDQIFKGNEIVYTNSAAPLRYVVSIDYGKAGIDKVLHDIDEEKQKVEFYIVPSGKGFDFDNVSFDQEGAEYDITVTFDLKDFKELGKLYDDGEHLFRNNNVIAFTQQGVENLGEKTISLRDNQTYSSLMRAFIGHQMTSEIQDLLLGSVLEEVKILEGDVTEDEIEDVYEAVKSGADFNELLRNKYYSKSYKNLDLQIRLMGNVRVDKSSRLIWSVLSHDDVKFSGVTRKTLDTKGRIIFNISDDFDLALAAYEIEDSLFKVVIESNAPEKYSAKEIAEVFDGRGGKSHAICVLDNTSRKDVENVLFRAIKSLYQLDVSADSVGKVISSGAKDSENDNVIKKMSKIAEKAIQKENKNSEPKVSDSGVGESTEISIEEFENSDIMKPLTKPLSDDITTFDNVGNPVVIQDAELENEDLLD